MDVGKAEAAALELVAEFGVIDSQLVENGRLKIVNVDGVLVEVMLVSVHFIAIGIDNLRAVFIGVADGDATLDASASHPH